MAERCCAAYRATTGAGAPLGGASVSGRMMPARTNRATTPRPALEVIRSCCGPPSGSLDFAPRAQVLAANCGSYRVARDGRQLRHDRDRGRTRRLRRGDQGRPARPEDSRGRDGHPGRALPQLRLHPAKTLLHTAEVYDQARNDAAELGVKIDDVSLDWDAVGKRREKVRLALTGGVKMLFERTRST